MGMAAKSRRWIAPVLLIMATGWTAPQAAAAPVAPSRPAAASNAAAGPIQLVQGTTDFGEILRGVQRDQDIREGRRPPPRYRDDRRWDRNDRWERERRWERDRRDRRRWERPYEPRAYRGLSRRQAACAQRYRTYDPRTNTFFIRPGVRAVCRL